MSVAPTLLFFGGLAAVTLGSDTSTGNSLVQSNRRDDTYILSYQNEFLSYSATTKEVVSLSEKVDGDFIWVRRGGREWIIRDTGTVAEAVRLFQPMELLESEREALQSKQEQIGQEESALDEEEERLEDELNDLDDREGGRSSDSARIALERRLTEVETTLRDVRTRERELDAEEQTLDLRQDALERDAESALWELIDKAIANGLGTGGRGL